MSILERKFFGKYIKFVFCNTLMVNELGLTDCPKTAEWRRFLCDSVHLILTDLSMICASSIKILGGQYHLERGRIYDNHVQLGGPVRQK